MSGHTEEYGMGHKCKQSYDYYAYNQFYQDNPKSNAVKIAKSFPPDNIGYSAVHSTKRSRAESNHKEDNVDKN